MSKSFHSIPVGGETETKIFYLLLAFFAIGSPEVFLWR